MSDDLHARAIAQLPHGPRARWVRRVVSADAESIVGEGGVPVGCALVRDGRLPVVSTLELCAQTAALLEISDALLAAGDSNGGERTAAKGYVVRARRVRLCREWVDADVLLEADIRRAGAAPPLYTYTVKVRAGDEILLTGSIATFVPD